MTTLIDQGNELIKRIRKVYSYMDLENSIAPLAEINKIKVELVALEKDIPKNTNPKSLEEIYLSELKRRCLADLFSLETEYGEKIPNPLTIIDSLGITPENFQDLENWLKENKNMVAHTNEELLSKADEESRRAQIPLGNSAFCHQAEEYVQEKILSLINVVHKNIPDWPGLSDTLKKYTVSASTTEKRAYSDYIAQVAIIPVQNVAYMTNGKINLKPKELISLVAEELFVHACNDTLTQSSNLPYFLKRRTGLSFKTVMESSSHYLVADFFETLAKSPKMTNLLGFSQSFEEIYEEFKETELLNQYWNNIYRYAIWTLAKLGESRMKEMPEIITKYSVDPATPHRYLNKFAYSWDKSTGNLLPKIVKELIYFPKPVDKIMATIPPDKKDQTIKSILTGYWSQQGLKQWVEYNLSDQG